MRRQRAPKGAEGRRRRSLWPPVSALGAGLLASPSLATLPRSRTQADRDCRLRALRGAHRAPRPGGAGELPGRVARAGWPLPPPPCAAARPTAHLRGRELRAGTWAGACVCTCPVGFQFGCQERATQFPGNRDASSAPGDASCFTRAVSVAMVDSGLVGMPVFLFSSMLANIVFLVRACKDASGRNRQIAGGPAVAILACAISELIWCPPRRALPCGTMLCLVCFADGTPCFSSQGGAVLRPMCDRPVCGQWRPVVAQKPHWV